ncbi:uncharacterized protein BBA_09496 [Beauveria bassiana ARSEF 2860]|uniref:Uncharacterized protein n=1 Tax=Beauveria bassiana (strain ARSEF 2860) TaxID=655819 RepID=J5J4A6_BEAB2|nr:uncharacterized protein BBA_09496 [Beauveria bassiana ARSEF 2860]EJP61528.1 hypothetical protein BBA_09496 [Beauveria bassiana ARSEF 2860]
MADLASMGGGLEEDEEIRGALEDVGGEAEGEDLGITEKIEAATGMHLAGIVIAVGLEAVILALVESLVEYCHDAAQRRHGAKDGI